MAEQQPELQQVKFKGGGEIANAYANVCNITATPEEVFLHFGQRDADNPMEARSIEKLCLSLPHAKRLAIALAQTLKIVEEAFGPIVADPAARLTPEIRRQLGLPPAEGEQSEH
jgi:hypothetical protein